MEEISEGGSIYREEENHVSATSTVSFDRRKYFAHIYVKYGVIQVV
jgi:hypothetical protein